MKLLLLGREGQLGRELQRALSPLGELIALSRKPENGLCGDLQDFDALRRTIRTVTPDVIVNAAAYTAVDAAETALETAWQINALAPAVLAEEATRCRARLVHYSTDYVFDGLCDAPYHETDTPNPLSVYGASKLEGERDVVRSGSEHLVFRTSWVYAPHGHNFARTMLRLAHEREHLQVVDDQFGAPTSAELIADVTALCLHRLRHPDAYPPPGGLYHLSASGYTSWYGWARFLLEQAAAHGMSLRAGPDAIEPIASRGFPQQAQRPANSRLDTSRLERTMDLRLPPWQWHVTRTLALWAAIGGQARAAQST